MITPIHVAIISEIVGADLRPLIAARDSLRVALSKEDQAFVSAHWPHMAAFFNTQRGKEISQLLVQEWREVLAQDPTLENKK